MEWGGRRNWGGAQASRSRGSLDGHRTGGLKWVEVMDVVGEI